MAQKYIFCCTPCRKSLKRKFAKKYVSSAGIPLVEEVNKRPNKKPKESKDPEESLEGRIQILETLLEDYYLDAYYLKKVKKTVTKHAKREYLLKKYKQNENEAKFKDKETEPIDKKESITVEIPTDE